MGNYFEKNPQFKEKIQKWLGDHINNNLPEIDQFDFVIKYVEETIGLIISNTYQKYGFRYRRFLRFKYNDYHRKLVNET